jgi:hypothetical protein
MAWRYLLVLLALVAQTPAARGKTAQEASPKPAMAPEAKQHYDRAIVLAEQQDYRAASAEFQVAYSIDPRREIHFAWAQVERLYGNCPTAMHLYEKYLSQGPPPRQAEVARIHIARCHEVVRPPWYKDVLGDILVGSGVVALGVGAAYWATFESDDQARFASTNEAQYLRVKSNAADEQTIATVSISAGVGLIAGGVIRYLTRGPRREGPTAGAWIHKDGLGLVLAGQF